MEKSNIKQTVFPSHCFMAIITFKVSVYVATPEGCEEMVQYNIKDLFDES